MNAWPFLFHSWFSFFPTLFIQDGDSFARYKQLMGSSALSSELFIKLLISLMGIVLLIMFLTYQYQRWRRYRDFVVEMKALDLDPGEEGTFAGMVKRYSMDEPVRILFSPRLFDEMATTEIFRVLGSAGSQEAKEEFINSVYDIRKRTYHPEWRENTVVNELVDGKTN